MPTGVSYSEALKVMQADGPALTTNNVSTSLITPQAKPLIKANSLFIGKTFRIDAYGQATTLAVTSSTHAVNLLIGASNVFTSTSSNLAAAGTNTTFNLELWLVCRAIGAAANFFIEGTKRGANTTPSTVFSLDYPLGVAPAVGGNFDNTIDQLLDLQFLIQTSSITSIQLNQFIFESLN